RAADLLVGRRRGLFLFAPIVLLAAPGWGVLGAKRLWGEVAVTGAACVAIFVVNLSYPEWTGGWSTGPRLLVPLLPFAMVPVAALLAVGGRRATAAAGALAVAGGAIVLLFQGVGGRIPEFVADPLGEAVWPLWRGAEPPGWVTGGRFTRTVVGWAWPAALGRLPETRRWVEFLPLLAFQAAAIAAIMARPARASIDPSPRDGRPIRSTDPGAQETKRT
ncbi:MAG TPA: hypothetical protein VF590_12995, partial [Isosphaeraceae bacterium]